MIEFDVPDMGKISVRTGKLVPQDGGGFRRYHTVTFHCANGGSEEYSIGSPVFRFGSEYTLRLYDTVHAAISFLNADGSDEADDWASLAAIPFGTATAFRLRYHVVDDGHGGSDATDGEAEREEIPLTRYYGESAGDAVWRCLSEWDGWADVATFDSLCPPFMGWETWRTVPTESAEDETGIPQFEHGVSFAGDVVHSLTEVAREWTESGRAWR